MASDLHVTPEQDLRDHDDRTRHCWCHPTVILVDAETGAAFPEGRAVVVHHSADGRELVEQHGAQ